MNKKLTMLKKEKLITLVGILLLILFLVVFINKSHGSLNTQEYKLDKKQFAVYIKNGENYEKYSGNELYPSGYMINLHESYCLDKEGQKIDTTIKANENKSITVTSSKTVYCTLYFDPSNSTMLEYDNTIINATKCVTVQCALDELYTIIH